MQFQEDLIVLNILWNMQERKERKNHHTPFFKSKLMQLNTIKVMFKF